MLAVRPWLANRIFMQGAFLAFFFVLGMASEGLAQSRPPRHYRDPVEQLGVQVQDLKYVVQQARLQYPILASVDQLEHASRVLDYCVSYGDPDRRGRWGRSDGCRSELRETRHAFGNVQNHLYDSQYRYPQVHRQFVDVQYALERVEKWFGYQPQPLPPPAPVPVPPPPPFPPAPPPAYPVPPAPVPNPQWLRATGSMEHISFDLRGNRIQIQHQCHEIAARVGLVWVRAVYTNGAVYQDPYGRALHVNDACRYVAQSAY